MSTCRRWMNSLHGVARQEVAEGIWAAWRDQHRRVAVLTGFTGVGKTELANALRTEAVQGGGVSLRVTLPLGGVADLDAFVRDQLAEEATDAGLVDLARRLSSAANLQSALKTVLGAHNLVVIDDFQEVLDEGHEPPQQVLKAVEKFTKEVGPGGLLLLVTNRSVAVGWPDGCHVARLEAPAGDDAIAILRGSVLSTEYQPSSEDAEAAALRLGGNPRALGLLGAQLDRYTMEELLGDEPDTAPAGPANAMFLRALEERLVGKALAGLDDEQLKLLNKLAVLRLPANDYLASALAGGSTKWGERSRPLRDRYLVRLRSKTYQVHPAAREILVRQLYQRSEEFKSSHVLAADWYAEPIRKLGKVQDNNLSGLGHRLDEARFHYGAAGAADALGNLLSNLRGYIEKRFHSTTSLQIFKGELDSRIELLEAFLNEPGKPGTEQHLAQLLEMRRSEGDLVRAVVHAKLGTTDQSHGVPWVLWAKLEAEVNGKAAGAEAAQAGVAAVSPGKDLHPVYTVLGACLAALGQTSEAIEAMWAGYQRDTTKKRHRLIEEAIWFAAASQDLELLDDLIEKCAADVELAPKLVLARLLRLMREGAWQEAAEAAKDSFAANSRYVQTAMLSALAWLGVSNAEEAQAELDRLPQGLHLDLREGGTWLAALVAVQSGDLQRARYCYKFYAGEEASDTLNGLRADLLREWDERIGVIGEAMPSLNFPVLPGSVTGLDHDIVRSQYGAPVLPDQIKSNVEPVAETTDKKEEPNLTPIFTWVHLSDIHMGHGDATHKWDQRLVLAALLEDLRLVSARSVPLPDAIFVTGDVAFSGGGKPGSGGATNTEYADAASWLADAASAVGVATDSVYVVPGNHDVDRNIDKDRDIARLIRDLRDKGKLDGSLDDAGDMGKLARRQSKYLDFAKSFAPQCAELYWSATITRGATTVSLLGLNTALLAAQEEDKQGDRSRLQVGNQQWMKHATGDVTVVLSHHPFMDGWLRDESDAKGWLRTKADIHLCGHVHSADSEALRNGGGGELVTVVAGAAHMDADPAVKASHGYNIASLLRAPDGRLLLRVWPRRWSNKKDFRLDTDNVPDGQQFAEHVIRTV